ncbi:MAG: hypothetical protein FWD68_14555 [Alphaproteobacteria bacterium]|nr:hypothetical protein [Alphaproteobacteria bacterium]
MGITRVARAEAAESACRISAQGFRVYEYSAVTILPDGGAWEQPGRPLSGAANAVDELDVLIANLESHPPDVTHFDLMFEPTYQPQDQKGRFAEETDSEAHFEASDKCLLGIALSRDNGENEDDRAGIDELLGAFEELTQGWLEPLGVDMMFDCFRPESPLTKSGSPDHPALFLCADPIPVGLDVTSILRDPFIHTVSEIDATVLRHAANLGLAQTPPAGRVVSLSEILIRGSRVLSPLQERIALFAPEPESAVSEIVDGERWCCGPAVESLAGPPAWLFAVNNHVTIEIRLEIFWDLWVGFPPGRAMVDAGIGRVLMRGGWTARQYFPPLREGA